MNGSILIMSVSKNEMRNNSTSYNVMISEKMNEHISIFIICTNPHDLRMKRSKKQLTNGFGGGDDDETQ